MQRIRGIFRKPQANLESIITSVLNGVIPPGEHMEWQTPNLMKLLGDLYKDGAMDQRFMKELQLASNVQDNQSDYLCTADPSRLNTPVWAHSTPQNVLEGLAELADRFNAGKVYGITAR